MKEVKLIKDFNNLKKDLTFNIPKGLTILTGINGSGKTNILKYLNGNYINHGYILGEVSFIDISHITSVISDQSDFNSLKSLYKGQSNVPYSPYVNSFLEYINQQDNSQYTQAQIITNYANKMLINDNIQRQKLLFLEFITYLEYLNNIGINLDDEKIKNRKNYDNFIQSGKVNAAIETPVSRMFIQACLAFYTYKAALTSTAHDEFQSQGGQYNINYVNEHLVNVYGTCTPPWERLNSEFEKYGFCNRLIAPIAMDSYRLLFEHVESKVQLEFNNLSTGEKIIVLIMSFILYENRTVKLLLIDELDAYLNPKMSEMLINILKDFVINKNKIDVIMTTHNPITVNCLDAEEDTIYWMDNGEIKESTKQEVLQLLTPGMFTFNNKAVETIFNISGKECFIFTEGHTDAIHIECAIKKLKPALLNKLHFMDCGKGKTSAQILKEILEKLALIQNLKIPKIIGIFDKDADGKRYYGFLKSSKMGALFRDNSNYLKCKEFYAILLNPSNQNQHNESYAPIELMYSINFLLKYDVIKLISNPSEKQSIQNCYIKGEDIFKESIDTEKKPFDVYLVNDSQKDTFANMIKNSLNTLNVSDFSGFQGLIDTIEQICSR